MFSPPEPPSGVESLTKIEMRLKGGGKAKQAVHRMAGDAMYVGAKVRPPTQPHAVYGMFEPIWMTGVAHP